jgi:hypothetical protein
MFSFLAVSATYEQHTAHLTEKYKQLSANYEQLRQMVMNMASQSGDTCAPPFWPYNNQPPPLLYNVYHVSIRIGN